MQVVCALAGMIEGQAGLGGALEGGLLLIGGAAGGAILAKTGVSF